MTHRIAKVAGLAATAVGLVGAVTAFAASSHESLDPARQAAADLPTVTDFSFVAPGDGCVFDPGRGGMVYEGLTIKSRSTGMLELTFYVQRDSLDDVLPGYVSTALRFDDDSRSHTFDVVVPVTEEDYAAGYDECHWDFGGR